MTVVDPRADAPRDPSPRTPLPPTGAFRRTTHVAAGPAPGHDWRDGVDVPRVLHAGCRDLRPDGTTSQAFLTAATDRALTIEAVDVDPGGAPTSLLGLRAAPGLRGAVARAVEDVTTPGAAVLLDLGIGGTLSNYARMQAARESGRTTMGAMRPGSLERMAGSCRGWAADGELVAALRAGTERPSRRPPQVDDVDLDRWHELGGLPPGWVRRRRRIDVDRTGGTTHVLAAFRDSWAAPEGSEHALHEWELHLEVVDGRVTAATATPRSLPFSACPSVTGEVGGLVGVEVEDLRRRSREVLGSAAGCTHLDDLVSVVPAALAAARPA